MEIGGVADQEGDEGEEVGDGGEGEERVGGEEVVEEVEGVGLEKAFGEAEPAEGEGVEKVDGEEEEGGGEKQGSFVGGCEAAREVGEIEGTQDDEEKTADGADVFDVGAGLVGEAIEVEALDEEGYGNEDIAEGVKALRDEGHGQDEGASDADQGEQRVGPGGRGGREERIGDQVEQEGEGRSEGGEGEDEENDATGAREEVFVMEGGAEGGNDGGGAIEDEKGEREQEPGVGRGFRVCDEHRVRVRGRAGGGKIFSGISKGGKWETRNAKHGTQKGGRYPRRFGVRR
jgi:hypothetical protein